jgi:hypothetical protein
LQQHLTRPPLEQTPEGFVVYWNGVPVAKMKNRFYSDKHLLITGTYAHSLASGHIATFQNRAVVLTALCVVLCCVALRCVALRFGCAGNLLSNRNIAIERYFDGTIDDVLDVLPPPIHAFLDELKEKTKELIHEISRLVQQFANEVRLRNTPHTTRTTHATKY